MVFYILPESLTSYRELFEEYPNYILGDPELVEVDYDLETGQWLTDDQCFKLFCK